MYDINFTYLLTLPLLRHGNGKPVAGPQVC